MTTLPAKRWKTSATANQYYFPRPDDFVESVYDRQSDSRIILLHTDRNKEEANKRAIELLDLVGINEPARRVKQYPYELSGGMRQRVMIAMSGVQA